MPQWICLLCDVDETLESMKDTEEHMQKVHKKEVEEFGLSTVVSSCAAKTYGITSCPLCSFKAPKDTPELIDHVLQHTCDFAFHSLPWIQSAVEFSDRPNETDTLSRNTGYADVVMERIQPSYSNVDEVDTMKHHTSVDEVSSGLPLPGGARTEKMDRLFQNDDTFYKEESMADRSSIKSARLSATYSLSRPTNRTNMTQPTSPSMVPTERNEDFLGTESISVQPLDSLSPLRHDVRDDDHSSDEDMADKLARVVVKSNSDWKEFLPSGKIDGIVTQERVRQWLDSGTSQPSLEISHTGQHYLDTPADFISNRSKKIFTIMHFVSFNNDQIRQAMSQFQELGVDDRNLPLVEDENKRIFLSPTIKAYRQPWTAVRVAEFLSHQWKVLAPVFDNDQTELKLDSNHILPFTRISPQAISGTFGEVHKVTIHPNHKRNGVQVRFHSIISINITDNC